ncbi:MAG: hypothetical protein K2X25_09850 [Caulobacteraceae bacterium]|nr:hypothetical protein [Caulobacteraceae bacterium]
MSEALFYVGLVLRQTPFWVWAVLSMLVFLGIRRLRTRTTTLLMMSVTPGIFLVWSLVSAVAFWRGDGGLLAAGLWPSFLLLGLASFRLLGASSVRWVDDDRLVRPGTAGPLAVYVSVFLFRYGLEIWSGFFPDQQFLTSTLALLVSGYMAGRTIGDLWFAVHLKPRSG